MDRRGVVGVNLGAWMVASLLAAADAPPVPTVETETTKRARASAELHTQGYVVEAYYRIRWGYEEEFLALYRKNHLPFLRRALEKGSLLALSMEFPREHMPENDRWNLRTTLVYRDANAAVALAEIDEQDYVAIVGEHEAAFLEEEQRRFELLLAHWDVNISTRATFHAADLPTQVKIGSE